MDFFIIIGFPLGGCYCNVHRGKLVPIQVQCGKVKVGKAEVVKTDIVASNGVIHVIDTVLIPPK